MYTVTLREDFRGILEKEAEAQQKTVAEIVDQAVRDYLLQRDKEKIAREQAAYERMHPELKRTHFGQWVAVHEGALVDADEDDVALHRRVVDCFGDTTVLITQVEDKPIREIWIRTPSTGRLR